MENTNVIIVCIAVAVLLAGYFIAKYRMDKSKYAHEAERINDFVRLMKKFKDMYPNKDSCPPQLKSAVAENEKSINSLVMDFAERIVDFEPESFSGTEFENLERITRIKNANYVHYPIDSNDVFNPEMLASQKNFLTDKELKIIIGDEILRAING